MNNKYYIQNGEKHSKRNCKCVDGTALFKLCGQNINGKEIGFWECKNCSSKQPFKPHAKFFKELSDNATSSSSSDKSNNKANS